MIVTNVSIERGLTLKVGTHYVKGSYGMGATLEEGEKVDEVRVKLKDKLDSWVLEDTEAARAQLEGGN